MRRMLHIAQRSLQLPSLSLLLGLRLRLWWVRQRVRIVTKTVVALVVPLRGETFMRRISPPGAQKIMPPPPEWMILLLMRWRWRGPVALVISVIADWLISLWIG